LLSISMRSARGERAVRAGVLARHRLLRVVAVMLAVSGFARTMGSATFVLLAT